AETRSRRSGAAPFWSLLHVAELTLDALEPLGSLTEHLIQPAHRALDAGARLASAMGALVGLSGPPEVSILMRFLGRRFAPAALRLHRRSPHAPELAHHPGRHRRAAQDVAREVRRGIGPGRAV